MSSKAYIQQVTTIVHKTKQTTKSVSVLDDYSQGSICLNDYRTTFFEDDMELLMFVLEKAKTVGLDDVNDVFDSVYANKKGMAIEDTWYDWEQIEPVFEKAL